MILEISGERIGLRRIGREGLVGEIIRVSCESRPSGPAENAFVYIEYCSSEYKRGRYVSWINLYDIEAAAERQGGTWSIVEPHQPASVLADWYPYGWGGEALPSVADPVQVTSLAGPRQHLA